jgi:hypothetical protein
MKNSTFQKGLRRKAARIRQGFRDKRTAKEQAIIIATRRGESRKELRKLTDIIKNEGKK